MMGLLPSNRPMARDLFLFKPLSSASAPYERVVPNGTWERISQKLGAHLTLGMIGVYSGGGGVHSHKALARVG